MLNSDCFTPATAETHYKGNYAIAHANSIFM